MSQYFPEPCWLVKKTDNNTKITEIENKILLVLLDYTFNTNATWIGNKLPYTTNLAMKASLNTTATVIESKIPDLTNLATKASLNFKSHRD